ncbi:MAG: hypothetical protein LBR90_01575, partial [Elusimicrobiota bacterium]|nr:hypothetical protein [Elusimicrobiota bacterium]
MLRTARFAKLVPSIGNAGNIVCRSIAGFATTIRALNLTGGARVTIGMVLHVTITALSAAISKMRTIAASRKTTTTY